MADKFQLKALITGVDKLSPKLAGIRKNIAGFKKGLDRTGLGKIGFSDVLTGGALAAPFVTGAAAAIDFESEMADVRKVVNFDKPEQFKQMGDDIGRMSERLPMAAGDIAKIVAAGGQSGIAREELLGFAEAAVKMGIAFDQAAQESGDMMAKWRTSFKMTQVEVVGLADKINYLGNTGPANTKQISGIVTRIGPLGAIAGLAAGQIAALGATMAGVGIEEEVAATGIKNFMLAMTKGTSATKGQQKAFKQLRLDSQAVAKGMQKDAQGTIVDLLKRVSKVKPESQAGLLTTLFGSESVAAIAPLLTNLDLLQSNLQKVTDQKQYGNSMDKEYESRAATTANNLTLLRDGAASVARGIGNGLLPAINAVVSTLRPMVSQVAQVIEANPALVRGLAAAGIAFTAIRVGALAATVGLKLLSLAFTSTPIGIAAVAIAAAAGLIVANWSTIAPYFEALWATIKGPAAALWGWMKKLFAWSPVGLVMANWQSLSRVFGAVWDVIRAGAEPFIGFLRRLFDWSPLGMLHVNWDQLPRFFGALWDVVRALAVPFLGFLKQMFDWSPIGLVVNNWSALKDYFGAVWKGISEPATPFQLFMRKLFDWSPMGMIIKNWEPITAWFTRLWGKLRPILEPMMKLMGGGSAGETILQTATTRATQFAQEQRQRNAGAGGGTGAFLAARAVDDTRLNQQRNNDAFGIPAPNMLLARPNLPAPGSLLQQGAANGKTQLQGEMVMRFEGAPPGLRVDPAKTNQPGLSITPKVGYRTLGGGKP
jgi:TP901 family phage tail tape measure protein